MPQRRYDELRDDDGTPRGPVAAFQARTGVSVTRPPSDAAGLLTGRYLGGDARIVAAPLVLGEQEHAAIATAVQQRASTLQLLFHDLFSGPRAIVEKRRLFDQRFVARLTAQEGWAPGRLEQLWAGRDLDDVRFVYGPDLARGPDGAWVVLEDNIGCIGGISDAGGVLRSYLEATGASLHPAVPPADDLHDAASAFLAAVGLSVDHPRVVAFGGQSLAGGTDEAGRKTAELARLGICVCQPDDVAVADAGPSAVINLGGSGELQIGAAALEAFADSGTPILNAPGVGILGNKAWLPLLPAVVRFYLDEEPSLATPPTKAVDRLPQDDGHPGVLKRVDGCGGSGVYFLGEHRGSNRRALERQLGSWGPGAAVLQDFVERSVVRLDASAEDGAFRVELRPIVYVVAAGAVFVGRAMAGRASPSDADPRSNITQGAHHLAVVPEPVPRSTPRP